MARVATVIEDFSKRLLFSNRCAYLQRVTGSRFIF